jgi:hypothetical protein
MQTLRERSMRRIGIFERLQASRVFVYVSAGASTEKMAKSGQITSQKWQFTHWDSSTISGG